MSYYSLANRMSLTSAFHQSLLVKLVILTAISIGHVHSVIMPPRITLPQPDLPALHSPSRFPINQPPAYTISINDGESIEVGIESKSSITVSLNRPAPQDVVVSVTVYSGPDLISFDGSRLDYMSMKITFKKDTFGDKVIDFHTTKTPGHAEIVCKVISKTTGFQIDDSSAYISININRSWALNWIITIVGWVYFFAWSISFYFQVILNYQRKSVVGLNFDFLAFNLLGFTCYTIYNFTLKFSRDVQKDYYERYAYTRIPVEYNDLFFAVHAFVLTMITIIQCFIYERGQQTVSIPAGAFIALASMVGLGLTVTHLFNGLCFLDVVLYLSYVKLVLTIIKYMPQAYMNYKRKATTGWSIHNILLDFTGGALSILQMFLLACNYNDWVSIFGNFTKFGLGIVSVTFDILFVVQHYILYKQPAQYLEDSSESIPSPVISQSIRSSTLGPNLTGHDNEAQVSDESSDDRP